MPRTILDEARLHPAIREQVANHHADIVHNVQAASVSNPVLVVGMAQNPHVKKARRLLDAAGIPYQYLEYVSVGQIDSCGEQLKPASTPLLTTSPESARQLFKKFQEGDALRQKVAAIKRLVESDGFPLSAFFDEKRSYPPQ